MIDPLIDCEDRLPSSQGWTCEETEIKKLIMVNQYKPNDGVVTNESSFQFPGVNATVKMDKSNHMQMRNDGNTKTVLLTLYEGGLVDYFKTKTRN
ncbi:MAG: hypothetical protein ABIV51_08425 [Saprospiraceae bacterium]